MRTVSLESDDVTSLLRDSLGKGQSVSLKVSGTSMTPLLQHQKSIVFIDPISKPLKKNDVILFTINDKVILHRIIKLNPLTTRGDALINSESIIEEDVLGVVISYEKAGKTKIINHFGWQLVYRINRIKLYLKILICKVVKRKK